MPSDLMPQIKEAVRRDAATEKQNRSAEPAPERVEKPVSSGMSALMQAAQTASALAKSAEASAPPAGGARVDEAGRGVPTVAREKQDGEFSAFARREISRPSAADAAAIRQAQMEILAAFQSPRSASAPVAAPPAPANVATRPAAGFASMPAFDQVAPAANYQAATAAAARTSVPPVAVAARGEPPIAIPPRATSNARDGAATSREAFGTSPELRSANGSNSARPASPVPPVALASAAHARDAEEHSKPAARDSEVRAFREALVSPSTAAAVGGSIDRLKKAVADDTGAKVEAVLRPMLREWMDEHLPGMVERLVREEIARIASRD